MFGFKLYMDTDDSFSIDRALEVFDLESDMKMSKKEKFLDKMLNSKSFYGFIFVDNDGDRKEKLKKLYRLMSERENLIVICNTLDDSNYLEYPRTAAAFLYTVCTYVISACNGASDEVARDFKNGKIRRSEKEDKMDDIETNFAYAKKINNEYINKMIKPYAKKISNRSGVPKDVCMDIIKNIPEKAYINKKQIGSYLNILTDILYTGIDEYDEIDGIDWEPFFKALIGDAYAKDVAMYLTVEGAGRIERNWKNKRTVQDVWDSLTKYALDTLEELSSNDIDHMVELYKKIVASMSGDEKNDLRVDLTKVDDSIFPNIAKSVRKCYDTIKDAVNIAKGKKERFKSDDELPTLN